MTSSFSDLDARRLQALNVAASYLEVVQEDLIGMLQEDVIALSTRYSEEKDPVVRAGYWEQIRHTIRGLEGIISECEEFSDVFRYYARERFDKIWRALSFKERSSVIGDYKFQSFGDSRIARPNFLDSRRTAWIMTKRRIEYAFGDFSPEEKEKIVARMIDSADVAFAMCEYVFAIDDYEGEIRSPEVEKLLDVLINTIRALVFPKGAEENKTDEATKGDGVEVLTPNEECSEESAEAVKELASDALDKGTEQENENIADQAEELDEEEDDDEDYVMTEEEKALARKPDGYYPIDEYAAANAKRAISFDSYIPNSETNVYRAEVAHAREIAENHKKRIDERYYAKVDRFLDRFERRLADWYDRRNRAEASYPSILIVGAGNFSNARHSKKMERLGQLYKERDTIFGVLAKLEGIGTGGIRSDDFDALEKLEAKLKVLVENHERMKRANAYLRRKGNWEGYDDPQFIEAAHDSRGVPTYFYLANSNQEIRRIESRIESLKRQARTDYGDGWKFDGGIAKANKEISRLQIFFDSIPDDEMREKLKGRGFRWSPKNKAWQRQLSVDAIWTAKTLGFIPNDWKPKLIDPQNQNENGKK